MAEDTEGDHGACRWPQEGAEPTCVGLGLMCHKDHEWAGLNGLAYLLEAFFGKGPAGDRSEKEASLLRGGA